MKFNEMVKQFRKRLKYEKTPTSAEIISLIFPYFVIATGSKRYTVLYEAKLRRIGKPDRVRKASQYGRK